MRIIVEIEGENVAVRTERADARATRDFSELSRPDVFDSPPPEVLRAAAALGASSAGRAPYEAELAALGSEFRPDAVKALAEPADAGAAPFAPPGLMADDREVGEAAEEDG